MSSQSNYPNEYNSFEFSILSTIPNTIDNISEVEYEYLVDPLLPPVNQTNDSNISTLIVNQAVIDNNSGEMTKFASPDPAKLGETITYTVVLKNTGNTTANNVFFSDTLPYGTILAPGSLNPNPPSSIPVGSLGSNEVTTVSFQVILNSLPVSGSIPNTSSVNFTFTVDPSIPNGATGSGNSNTILTNANQAIIDDAYGGLTKSSSPSIVVVGDTITYTIALKNTGNTTATNIFLYDTIPAETTLAPGSLNPNPPSSISIADLAPNATSTVSFQVVVNTLPISGSVPNVASVNFDYTADPSIPNGASGNGNSNNILTTIYNPKLIITQAISQNIATKDDILTYVLVVKNAGDFIAQDTLVFNPIPLEYEYIPTSLTIDGLSSSDNPDTGIDLGDIPLNKTITIIYKVKVISAPPINPITNTAYADYVYTVNSTDFTRTDYSNPVSVIVNIADFTAPGNFVKTADKSIVSKGDTITYTLSILNTGNTNATSSILTDTLPEGLEFVAESVTINGVPTSDVLNLGINLGTITPNNLTIVTFEALVVTVPNSGILLNEGVLNYNYTLDPLDPDGAYNTVISSSSSINALNPDFTNGGIILSQDVDLITIGEIVTYTFTITNKGNTSANNTILKDILVSELEFVPSSVTIDNVSYPLLTPDLGIALGSIDINETVIVSLKAKVISQPIPPTIDNLGTLDYTYTVDILNPNSYSGTIDSNTVTLDYIHLSIQILHSSNRPLGTTPGDTITYRIDLINDGEIDISTLLLNDEISPNTVFVHGSVVIDGVSYPPYSPISGIYIPSLPIGESKTIYFDAYVLPTTLPTVTSQPSLNFDYRLTPISPISNRTIPGPLLSTPVLIPSLSIIKSANRDIISLGTTVTYQIDIENNGDLDLIDLNLMDPLNKYTEYIGNLIINGVPSSGSLLLGVPIGNLAIGDVTTVLFDAVLIKMPPQKFIENTATVIFEYEL